MFVGLHSGLALKNITFLGLIIHQGFISTEDKTVTQILNLQIPQTKNDIQSLLGLINYYAKFVPNFDEKIALFSNLLKKDAIVK